MSTLRVDNLQNSSGTGQSAMSGAAKAWVNFNVAWGSSGYPNASDWQTVCINFFR